MTYGVRNRLQTEVFLYAFGAGFLIGLFFAVLMLLRKLFRHSTGAVIAEDVCFCVIAALLSFLFLFDFNNGCVRLNLILSEFSGFLCVRIPAAKILSKN
ncbi:MAG: spore cortex biosynthesis protein YabQ [Clostridia bacterium]|nr:spore cortex biosynthesis protein YabQ [Clostridia bacterium]